MLPRKIHWILTPIALSIISFTAHADHNLGMTPPGWKAHPPIHILPPSSTHATSGFTPAQIQKAYGFSNAYQGAGQVIAIVDAYDNPNIEADLGVFSQTYGLPACTTANGCFTKIYASGTKPTGDTGWGVEMSLDVEWAHAIAPLAKIILVEAASDAIDLYEAVNVAIQNHATVISLSWGGPEFSTETSLDSIFKNSPVPITVSSGDSGQGVSYPAASPYVLSTGGTQITLDGSGNYLSETAWSGSGGGISVYETEPSYQTSYNIPGNGKGRGVPDVAYNAAPQTGYAIYDSYGEGGWLVVGGTSAAAPQWAALIANANSARGTNLTNFTANIYSAASASYSTLFHDVTSGQNGSCGSVCQAQNGYDYVTGLGSPKAPNLISYFSQTCVRANPTVAFSPASQSTTTGAALSYVFTVINNDTASCGASNFNLSTSVPASLNGSLSQNLLTLSPSAHGTATVQVSAVVGAKPSTYNISATASNAAAPTETATASASYVLNAASQNYSYNVYVGYPFNPVLINNSITCPDSAGNRACLLSNVGAGSTIVITGTGANMTDKCTLDVQQNGIIVDKSASNNCNVGLTAATSTSTGVIALPSGF